MEVEERGVEKRVLCKRVVLVFNYGWGLLVPVRALVDDAPRLNGTVDDGRRQQYSALRGRWTAAGARLKAKGDGRCGGRRARTRTVRWTVRRTVRTGEKMEEERKFLAEKVA